MKVLDKISPPDGGRGWIVVMASFMCNFTVGKFVIVIHFFSVHSFCNFFSSFHNSDGIATSFGILLGPLVENFDANRSIVSFIGSLMIGIYG